MRIPVTFLCPSSFFGLLGPHPQHMEVPRLGTESELQLQSCHSHSNSGSEPCPQPAPLLPATWILNPLKEARDRTCVLTGTSWVCYHPATTGTPPLTFLICLSCLLSLYFKRMRTPCVALLSSDARIPVRLLLCSPEIPVKCPSLQLSVPALGPPVFRFSASQFSYLFLQGM